MEPVTTSLVPPPQDLPPFMQSTQENAAEATSQIVPGDEELMNRILARESAALDQLYARYRPLIGKIVMEILPNESDAEEALQDVFMEIWNRAANFDARKGKALGWIICMARRRAIDHYRKIRRRADASEKMRLENDAGQGALGESFLGTKSVGGGPGATDVRQFLTRIIDSLPPEQGRVINLSYFKEMSQREIASRTGIPLGTIKTRLDLALRKLAQKSMPFRREMSFVQ